MRYRPFGSLDWEASILGLGVAGLPVGSGHPDEEAECVRMIRYAIGQGVNYLDLGHPYDLARQEKVATIVERALRGGYREKVKIALTIPVSGAESAGGFDRYLNRQMEWLKADSVDFCVLSRINRDNWPRVREMGFLDKAEQAIADGRVGNLGFAFHDHFQILRRVLKEYDKWTFAQFQFSYMDVSHDPGAVGLAYAADQGLGVVVTEPLKGGRLTKEPPESVRAIWAGAPEKWSLTEWGLRFVWKYPAVSTVVCGVSSMDQLVENVALTDQAEVGSFTVSAELAVNRVRDAYQRLRAINCASCRPCLPCPQGIDVPRIFEIYNDAIVYGDTRTASSIYHDEGHRADECLECGSCERKCARRYPLPIIDLLKTAHELLATSDTRASNTLLSPLRKGQIE